MKQINMLKAMRFLASVALAINLPEQLNLTIAKTLLASYSRHSILANFAAFVYSLNLNLHFFFIFVYNT